MKVLLTKSVEDLGSGGDVIDVASGYARNYLIPRKLAIKASPGAIRNADQYRKKAMENQARILSEAEELAGKIGGFVCTLTASADESGQLYGSITERHISDVLTTAGFDVDPGHVLLNEHIKALGEFTVPIKIYGDLRADITITVVPEEV